MINWIFVSEPPADASPIDEFSLLELQRIFPQGETLNIFSLIGLPERVFYEDCVPKTNKKFVRFSVKTGEKMTTPIYWRK